MARVRTCPRCRALLEPGTRVCPYCGVKPGSAAPPPVSEEAAATSRLGLWAIGVILVVYVLMVVLHPSTDAEGLERFEPSEEALLAFGISDVRLVDDCGHYWRLVTSIFVHLGVIHLLFNSVAIFILVPPAALTLGPHRTACLFVATGFVAACASHAMGHGGGGASGAVCGLIGALAVYGWRRGGPEGAVLKQRMVTWAIVVIVFGLLVPGVGNVAHVAGLLSGAALGYPAAAARVLGGRADRLWRGGAYASVAALLAVAAVWLLPNVIRSLDRRDLEVYGSQARRTLETIRRVGAGEDPPSRLPEALAEGPAGTEELALALNGALRATRRAPASRESRSALQRAWDLFSDWKREVLCSHGIDWRDPPG